MEELLGASIYRFLSEPQKRAMEGGEEFVVGSTIGSVRDRNEDVAVIVDTKHSHSAQEDYTLALVCDGMGGMASGRQAALIAASTFISTLLQISRQISPSERLRQGLTAAQGAVLHELRGKGGTTFSALYSNASTTWLIHVGDSRVYGVNFGEPLCQITRDDTIGAAFNRRHAEPSDFNRLIQFVGVDGDLEPQELAIKKGEFDGFLLTSDGAHNAPSQILTTVAFHSKGPTELVRKLLLLADVLGGLDNATAAYIPSNRRSQTSNQGNNQKHEEVLATILCPSGQHEIWIVRPNEAQTEVPSEPLNRPHRPTGAKNRGAKKRSARAAKRDMPPQELPLEEQEPVVKIDFSEDGGEKKS